MELIVLRIQGNKHQSLNNSSKNLLKPVIGSLNSSWKEKDKWNSRRELEN